MTAGVDSVLPYLAGGGGGVGVLFLVWRVIIWADTRTRADNAALRSEMQTMKQAHHSEITGLQEQINQFRREQRASEDLAAEYKRQLILAGLYREAAPIATPTPAPPA